MSMPPSELAISATRCVVAVDDHADVQLVLDVGAFLDEQPAHLLALGAGLVRDQLHAEDLRRRVSHSSIERASLTPPPLPRPPAWICALTTQTGPPSVLRGLDRLVDGERRDAPRHGHAELREDFLALVLVDLHVAILIRRASFARIANAFARPRIRPRRGTTWGSTRARCRSSSRARGSGRAGKACPGLVLAAQSRERLHGGSRQVAEQLGEMRAAVHAAQRVVQSLAKSIDEVGADELAVIGTDLVAGAGVRHALGAHLDGEDVELAGRR